MAPHSSILAWEILWTEEPGGLQPAGSEQLTFGIYKVLPNIVSGGRGAGLIALVKFPVGFLYILWLSVSEAGKGKQGNFETLAPLTGG